MHSPLIVCDRLLRAVQTIVASSGKHTTCCVMIAITLSFTKMPRKVR